MDDATPLGWLKQGPAGVAAFNAWRAERRGTPADVFSIHTLDGAIEAWSASSEAAMPDMPLRQANLSGRALDGVDLSGAALDQVDLSATELEQARFAGALLTEANLDQCKARGSDFRGATLTNVSFRKAELSSADFRDAKLAEVDFEGANLTGANLEGLELRGLSLKRVDFSGANLKRARILDCDFAGARWDAAELEGALFCPAPERGFEPVAQASLDDEFERQLERLRTGQHPTTSDAVEVLVALDEPDRIIAAYHRGKVGMLSAFQIVARQGVAARELLVAKVGATPEERRTLALTLLQHDPVAALDVLLEALSVPRFGFGGMIEDLHHWLVRVSSGRRAEVVRFVAPLVGELSVPALRNAAARTLVTLWPSDAAVADAVLAALRSEVEGGSSGAELAPLVYAVAGFGPRARAALPLLTRIAAEAPSPSLLQAANAALTSLNAPPVRGLGEDLADIVWRHDFERGQETMQLAQNQLNHAADLSAVPLLKLAFGGRLKGKTLGTLSTWLGRLIRNTRDGEATALLAGLFSDERYTKETGWLISAAAMSGAAEVTPFVRPHLDHRQHWMHAMACVGAARDEDAVEPLAASLGNPTRRLHAVWTLRDIGSPRAIPHLLGLLRLPRASKKHDQELAPRREACTALGRIGDATTARELCALLREPAIVKDYEFAIWYALCALRSPESFEDILTVGEKLARKERLDLNPGSAGTGTFDGMLEYFLAVGQAAEPRALRLATTLASPSHFARLAARDRGVLRRIYGHRNAFSAG